MADLPPFNTTKNGPSLFNYLRGTSKTWWGRDLYRKAIGKPATPQPPSVASSVTPQKPTQPRPMR